MEKQTRPLPRDLAQASGPGPAVPTEPLSFRSAKSEFIADEPLAHQPASECDAGGAVGPASGPAAPGRGQFQFGLRFCAGILEAARSGHGPEPIR